MRFLMLHVNSFCCAITIKGRSHLYEEYTDPVTQVDKVLQVLRASSSQPS